MAAPAGPKDGLRLESSESSVQSERISVTKTIPAGPNRKKTFFVTSSLRHNVTKRARILASGLYYKNLAIVIYGCNDSTIVIYGCNDSTIVIYGCNDSTIVIYYCSDSGWYYKTIAIVLIGT
jgi:hypothetical protein